MDKTDATSDARTSVRREDLWFDSCGTRCAAWFYVPEGAGDEPPLVVLAHGLGGTRHMRLDDYARRFAAAGIAALVFDYRGFGDSEGDERQIVNVRAQLEDWRAALAFARAELPIDPSRIAIWGTSFGGGHVLSIAAEDHHLAGVVAQCPFSDGVASMWRRTIVAPLSAAVLMVLAIVDGIRGLAGRRPLLVPMAGMWWMPAFLASRDSLSGACLQAEPGTVLAGRAARWVARMKSLRGRLGPNITISDRAIPAAEDTLWGTLVTPAGAFLKNAIAARLVLTLAAYRPARKLRRTGSTPILICGCDADTVAPIVPTARGAEGCANVTLNRYPYGHFDIYVGDAFERASSDQLEFLRRVLALEPAVSATSAR